MHARPSSGFAVRKGFYRPKCRAHPVPRFKCRSCGRGFSRQTFRFDYRDHRPDLNARVFQSIATGMGLRQTARNVGLSRHCTELKFRKIARHLRRLGVNLAPSLPEGSILQFDELETFECRRNSRPLSVPLLIDRETRFVIWAEAAPIRPRGKMSTARKRAMRADERRYGRRKDLSRRSILRTLERSAPLVREHRVLHVQTDEKSTYPGLLKHVFSGRPVLHQRTNSRLPRTVWNPLFPINSTEAMLRDLLGRMRRESWLVSKKRRFLDLGLQLWMAYRNFVRRRFNPEHVTPAQMLGLSGRPMAEGELLTWRQDWGSESPHPFSRSARSVSSVRRVMPA